MKRLDAKLARIRAGQYRPTDFIIADAKDPDMGPSISSAGPKRERDGTSTRYRTREEFLDQIRALIEQDIVDVMLASVGNIERLAGEGRFATSAITPAFRANDTTDIWVMRGAAYARHASRPFRTANLAHARRAAADLGLYSITFNHDIERDVASLEAFREFRRDAEANNLRYFLEVFNPNIDTGIDPAVLPHFINDCIYRCLAGLTAAERPLFLKLVYNGPKALEELAGYDPALVVGVLGGGAGTTRDCFELLAQAERYGARVALFGRKINLAESPLDIVRLMRAVASREVGSEEAVRAYHGELQRQGIKPARALEDDVQVTEKVLLHAASS